MFRYILFFILSTLIGCTSIVRFSDKSNENTQNQKEESRYKPIYDKSNQKSGYTSIYSTNIQKLILEEAEKWIGTPYKYGGMDKNGIDCSGLTYNVYLSVGTILPRTAEQQFIYTKRINIEDLNVGDLIFFTKNGKVSHVGIYAGNNSMIHASSSNGVVHQSLDSYTNMTIAGYGRPEN